MSGDKQTIAFYDDRAVAYACDTTPSTPPDVLLSFERRLPAGCQLLDLGSGGGWAAAAFRDLGHRVTAMDASANLLAEVEKLGGIATRHATFADMDWDGYFDAIWASFSLQHQPRDEMDKTLENITRALRPQGWLYIGIHEGLEDVRDALNRLYTPYTEPDLRMRLARVNIEIKSVERMASNGYDGREINCMNIEARKIG
jgi:SAM-dependent methyltransferase